MRILVVEDSTPTRELLARSLAAAGFEVTFASRITTGRRYAEAQAFDVIVLDIMLPDGSGLDLCRALRALGVLTPILFLTARGDVQDRIAGLDAGGDDYLRKPFALAELTARLRALGRRRGLAPPARLEGAGTVIDFTARSLARDGTEVPLTAREWGVLELLASRRGRVVSRDELLETLWGEQSPEASASLGVIMSRLRRKLGDAPEGWRVSTVRGEGYRFEASR
jgi:two-component system, OmpR family, response regulator